MKIFTIAKVIRAISDRRAFLKIEPNAAATWFIGRIALSIGAAGAAVEHRQLVGLLNKLLEEAYNLYQFDDRMACNTIVADLFHDLKCYNGYNYLAWLSGGYEAWVDAGKPESREAFIGDQSRIAFYA